MTRRRFVLAASLPVSASGGTTPPLIVPVHQVMDNWSKFTPEQLQHFSSTIWPEALRDFRNCDIQLQDSRGTGEVRRSPGGRPVFTGLRPSVINLVLTHHVPLNWDRGRGVVGVSTRYDGYDVCVIALSSAHGHQIPFVSLNTCVHELLHVLLQDILETRPKGLSGQSREFRIDWYATRMWLFNDGSFVRKSAQLYVDRLRHAGTQRSGLLELHRFVGR